MHISRVVIENFRNFECLDLSGLPPSHVLVGENRSGKSNFVHALRLVLDPSLPDASRHLVADDFWDGLGAPFGGAGIAIAVEITGFDGDGPAEALFADHLVELEPRVARLNYRFQPQPHVEPVSAKSYEFVLFGGHPDNTQNVLGREIQRYVSIRMLPALRDAEGDLAASRSPLRRLIEAIEVDPLMVDAATKGVEAAGNALLADAALGEINAGISSRMQTMVGDAFSVPTKLGIAPSDGSQIVRQIRLLVEDGGKERSVGQTSLGSANVLYLALLLELFASQERAQASISTVLAVEEPEAHLHPHVQRVLFRQLLGTEQSLLVTTHSPHIAAVTPLESVTLLKRTGGTTSGFHARSLDLDARAKADVERYLDVTRAELLFARAVILVEGAAEQFLVPAVAAALGIDLDASGISVCSVHGTDFAPYCRLLNRDGLNIPFVLLTDGDPGKNETIEGLERAHDLVSGDLRAAVRSALDAKEWANARRMLHSANIFVGGSTLELDLLPSARHAMLAAYAELETAQKARNFDADLTSYLATGSRSVEILDRITRVGKGRYAQRLAAHAGSFRPPLYMTQALVRVRRLSRSADR